jgi:hypothetical protein
MSNEFAIAAVTFTLHNLLDKVKQIKDSEEFSKLPVDARPTAEILVTNLSLDKAHELDKSKNNVNLFLYHVEHNAAWRNTDIPNRVKLGETGRPLLAINLYYIITTYGQNGSELISHLLLGKAMSLLHDHPVFGRDEIKIAFEVSELHEQIERLRITPQPISLEDASKLWTGFQTQYRLSAAYEVSVLLIESKLAVKTPLPVLTRGAGDEGIAVQENLVPPFPTLEAVSLPNNQPSARLNDVLTISGHHLGGDSIVVHFTNPRMTEPIEVTPMADGTATEIKVKLPDEPDNWLAGFYTISAVISRVGQQDRTTNEIPVTVAPRIINITIGATSPPVVREYIATVTCSPEVTPEQNVALLLNDREFPAESRPARTGTLSFLLSDILDGEYFARLRIDGVDSLLVDRSVTPPVFDVSQKVTIP